MNGVSMATIPAALAAITTVGELAFFYWLRSIPAFLGYNIEVEDLLARVVPNRSAWPKIIPRVLLEALAIDPTLMIASGVSIRIKNLKWPTCNECLLE
jgi:hypothetical protein